ncbi:MAG: hypothetical protein OIF56_00145 [Cohaesibacter sp.]|nr:hypothetical protein [Cohaesibacter sp.]
MCELALMIAGTMISAAGQMSQAHAQADAANYNARVAEMNAQIAEKRSKDAFERGQQDEQKKRQDVAQIQARQKAAMAANGVDLGYGSALDLLVDSATMGELDALTIRSNTAREAYNHDVDAVNKRSQSQLFRMEAKAAKTGGYLNAMGTLIGGASGAYKGYRQSRIGAYA